MSVFDEMNKVVEDFIGKPKRKPMPVNKKSVRQVTIAVLNTYEHGRKFTSVDNFNKQGLKWDVVRYLYDNFGIVKDPHESTCLRYLREENDPVEKYHCYNQGKSLYEVIRW